MFLWAQHCAQVLQMEHRWPHAPNWECQSKVWWPCPCLWVGMLVFLGVLPKVAWSPRGFLLSSVSIIPLLIKLDILPYFFLWSHIWFAVDPFHSPPRSWLLSSRFLEWGTWKWSTGLLHGHREACLRLSRHNHRADRFPILTVCVAFHSACIIWHNPINKLQGTSSDYSLFDMEKQNKTKKNLGLQVNPFDFQISWTKKFSESEFECR